MVTIEELGHKRRKGTPVKSSKYQPPPLSLSNCKVSPSQALAQLLNKSASSVEDDVVGPASSSSSSSTPDQASGSPTAQETAASAAAQCFAAALRSTMKVPPISLPSVPLPLPFSPELLWRYPNPFLPQPPPSPLEMQLRTQLPGGLTCDPRSWSREEVNLFLRYCEREYDLEKIDMDKFQMNGKALCLLNKTDLAERCAGAGDVIHNLLQILIREFTIPSSPLTPRPPGTSLINHHPSSPALPLSPHAWPLFNQGGSSSDGGYHNLSHLISQANSVSLSPSSPSIDSQNSSPKLFPPPLPSESLGISSIHQLYPPQPTPNDSGIPSGNNSSSAPTSNGLNGPSSSSHSDSEDSDPLRSPTRPTPRSPKESNNTPSTPSNNNNNNNVSAKNEDAPELITNGRLLWDFLQQLLNDSSQRFTSYIAWKNKDTGIFKIVDPAGLAKLWGIQKNHLAMNYDKMSRALRYYYRVNILRKVQGERHCYQFLRNPSELKSIKNISLLRQQMDAQAAATKLSSAPQTTPRFSFSDSSPPSETPPTPMMLEEEIKTETDNNQPTDLSMDPEEKAFRQRKERERILLEKHFNAFAKGGSSDSEEQKPVFDFRSLLSSSPASPNSLHNQLG
eukprot:TRINITY_DN3561_c0_g2_i1.p1 TRINITY_DN3561_c0_g2~~TRINITY_DN3561_c0_g2_i1.p1  ORF type:complete len:620 (+),score=192.12 TRINITY_DN3561_c0_g2_i1:127-1986(+)